MSPRKKAAKKKAAEKDLLELAYEHGNVVWKKMPRRSLSIEVLELKTGTIFEIDALAAKIFMALPDYPSARECLTGLAGDAPELQRKTRTLLGAFLGRKVIVER